MAIDLDAIIREHRLEEYADDIRAMAKPAIRLEFFACDEASIPVGSSKAGGCAEIPASLKETYTNDNNLLVQIDRREAARVLPGAFQATEGVVALYVKGADGDFEFTLQVFGADDGELVRMPALKSSYSACRVELHAAVALPSLDSPFLAGKVAATQKALDEWCSANKTCYEDKMPKDVWSMADALDRYIHLVSHAFFGIRSDDRETAIHSVFGYPQFIQPDRTEDFETHLVTDAGCEPPIRFLLQVDSDPATNFSFGDGGRVYCFTALNSDGDICYLTEWDCY